MLLAVVPVSGLSPEADTAAVRTIEALAGLPQLTIAAMCADAVADATKLALARAAILGDLGLLFTHWRGAPSLAYSWSLAIGAEAARDDRTTVALFDGRTAIARDSFHTLVRMAEDPDTAATVAVAYDGPQASFRLRCVVIPHTVPFLRSVPPFDTHLPSPQAFAADFLAQLHSSRVRLLALPQFPLDSLAPEAAPSADERAYFAAKWGVELEDVGDPQTRPAYRPRPRFVAAG